MLLDLGDRFRLRVVGSCPLSLQHLLLLQAVALLLGWQRLLGLTLLRGLDLLGLVRQVGKRA